MTFLSVLNTILSILIAIFAFGLMIFFHELGHFLTAKWAGVQVREFAIGMGPTLFKFTRKGTKYAIRALPIGGFVAMEGENSLESADGKETEEEDLSDGEELPAEAAADAEAEAIVAEERPETAEPEEDQPEGIPFPQASIPKRMIIMIAGAVMNLIFGFVIVLALTAFQPFQTIQIDKMMENAVTAEWLQEGDTFVAVGGKDVKYMDQLAKILNASTDGLVDVAVERDGQRVELGSVQFPVREKEDGTTQLAVDFSFVSTKRPPFTAWLRNSVTTTGRIITIIWDSLGDLVTGQQDISQLSGPVGITRQIGEVSAQQDWGTLLLFVAIISVNLGIVNMLPFPALDGGKVVILLIEGITRRKLNQKIELAINAVGLILLFGLIIVVTFKDVFNWVTGVPIG